MRMNLKAALTASALVGMGFVVACADSATAPTTGKFASKASYAVGALDDNVPTLGEIKICKTGNAGGSFDVTRVASGASTGTTSGLNNVIATTTCEIVAEDFGGANIGSTVTISEDAAVNTVSSVTACSFISANIGGGTTTTACAFNPATRFLNSFHGYVITYNNTFSPPTGCTLTQGFWKTHGPVPKGNNSNEWDLATITLGTVNYTQAQALSIFNTPVKGNGLISLAHQLMAAKLNIASGASGASISATITAADALIGGLIVPPVGSGSLDPSDTATLTGLLAAYNEGLTGPGHCGGSES